MKYRLREVMDALEYEELLKMKSDLDSGGFHLKKFLADKLHEEEKKHLEQCSNCHAELEPSNTNNMTIVFGPQDFRKKASFCGFDCLEYFVKELKELKRR
ncbi:MAG: hypothetical protein Q7S65_01105 [Nanoarchaeota archaeon]|nr:hypothetical protein [Nanoarchaeota archaeon]